ncbi:MAG: TadE/TadG family type IV pilus assembly protein [Pseudomonadota bacterium]
MNSSLKARLLQRAAGFVRNTEGNIAMMSGVIALPFMTMLALAVDVNYASNHRHTVQASLDSALLAAARWGIEGGATEAEMEAELSNYFSALVTANGGKVTCQAPDIDPNMTGGAVSADVSCYSETLMAGLIGKEKIEYEVEAEVNFGIGKIDVAFVYDVSGSMNDPVSDTGLVTVCDNSGSNCEDVQGESRMDALQRAAKAGVEQLLKVNGTDRDDVRIAMVSYNQAVNAGVYFEDVTGLSVRRTYLYGEGASDGGDVEIVDAGSSHKHAFLGLYDTRDNSLLATLNDGTVVTIPESYADHLALAAKIKSTSNKSGKDESMEIRAKTDDGWEQTRLENAAPYALYGDTSGDFYTGFIPTDEWIAVRMRAYKKDNAKGGRILNKTFDIRIDIEAEEDAPSITIEDSCTYERNTTDWNATVTPGVGNFLTADEASYDEDSQTWTIPGGCSSATPLPLTNDKAALDAYVDALPTGGGTAGHLGVAWGRYLIAPEWSPVWPVTSAPINYNEPDGRKIVIMMTDGQFNRTYHGGLGSSFDQAKNHCDQAKAQGVIIYTISFDAPTDAQAALDYCSSGTDYSFEVNNGQEILDAYTAIANRISDLRLSY